MKRKAFMTLISKVYKKTAEDLADNDLKLSDDNSADDAELDDDEVAKVITGLDGEKVIALKKTTADATAKSIEAQTAKKFEKKLRETFEIDDATLQGDALIEHIKETLPEGTIPADVSKLTAEELSKLPAVKGIIQQHKKTLGDLTKKHESELALERGKVGETELLNEVIKKGEARLNREGLKANLPEDAEKREARIEKLLRGELKGVKWKKDGNNLIPIDGEGVQLEDSNGNPLDFDTYVDTIIDTNFDFTPVTVHQPGPGNKNTPAPKQQTTKVAYSGRKPTNQEDYLDLLTGEELDVDQKSALKDNFSDKF